jgi:signal transduction histidine kinase
MRSLRLRIVVAVALVCAATLAGVASYIGHATLVVRVADPSGNATAAVNSAITSFVRSGRMAPSPLHSELTRLGAAYGVRIILVSPTGTVLSSGPIGASDVTTEPGGTIELRQRTPGSQRPNVLLLSGGSSIADAKGRRLWSLFTLPADPALETMASARASILRSIWQSAVLGIGAAVAVVVLLGSYIVKPIRELTIATKAMSQGETTRRVRVGAYDEIAQLAESFNVMASAIETTERLRRQMITDVAHELRSPLTRIIVQLEAADDGHVPRDEALAGVREEARRLERIVNDLRDLSLADAHELLVARQEIAIGKCIDEAVDRMRDIAAQAHVALDRNVAPALPAAVGDELRVAQVLENLISNALRYTPAGGHVVVGATADHEHIRCFVQDDGPGIAPGELPFIFERFYRSDPSRHRASGGSGLGLAIVKSLVEVQGGSVSVESRPGRGSRFTWTLPRSAPRCRD